MSEALRGPGASLDLSLSYMDLAARADLAGTAAIAAIAAALAQHPAGPVTALDVGGNHIDGAEAVDALVGTVLSRVTQLTSFDLRDNKISTEGAMTLFPALAKGCGRWLTTLSLNENMIKDTGMHAFATAALPGLTELHLVTNSIR